MSTIQKVPSAQLSTPSLRALVYIRLCTPFIETTLGLLDPALEVGLDRAFGSHCSAQRKLLPTLSGVLGVSIT